jgi:hypothetical protein
MYIVIGLRVAVPKLERVDYIDFLFLSCNLILNAWPTRNSGSRSNVMWDDYKPSGMIRE